MLNHFKDNSHLGYVLLYSMHYMIYGAIYTALGPMIPFLASISQTPETEYSFLFFCRSIGMTVGAFILKLIEKYASYHTIQKVVCLLIFVFCALFTYSENYFWQGIFMFGASICFLLVDIMINVCILLVSPNSEIEYWMLLTHGVFGIGGLFGPIFVYFFQEKSLLFIGGLFIIMVPFYIKLISPELLQENKIINSSEVIEQKQHLLEVVQKEGIRGSRMRLSEYNEKSKDEDGKQESENPVSMRIETHICLAMFIYVGIEQSFGGWISTYAVLSEVSSKESATSYSSIFWGSITFFRFGFAFIKMKTSYKLQILIFSSIVASIIGIFLIKILGQIYFGCIFTSIVFGLCFSSIFPLAMALPSEFNLRLSSSQTSNICLAAAISEGVLSMLVGYLMSMISINMLFYSILLMKMFFWSNNGILLQYCQIEEKAHKTLHQKGKHHIDQDFLPKNAYKYEQSHEMYEIRILEKPLLLVKDRFSESSI